MAETATKKPQTTSKDADNSAAIARKLLADYLIICLRQPINKPDGTNKGGEDDWLIIYQRIYL
jgi:hypothetical protein